MDREKDRLRDKQRLIEADLAYDSSEDKKFRKKNPAQWQRSQEERKRVRDKEREDDDQDR